MEAEIGSMAAHQFHAFAARQRRHFAGDGDLLGGSKIGILPDGEGISAHLQDIALLQHAGSTRNFEHLAAFLMGAVYSDGTGHGTAFVGLYSLGHIVIHTHDAADGAFAQRLGIAALIRMDDGIQRGEGSIGFGIPHGAAAGHGDFIHIQRLAGSGKIRKGSGGLARGTHAGAYILVEHEAVRVDLLGQGGSGGLDEETGDIVHGGSALQRFNAHIHGGDLIQRHIHGGFHDVVGIDALFLIKLAGGEDHRLAHLHGIALHGGKIGRVILIDQIGEHQVFHEAGQGGAGKVLDGDKLVGHDDFPPLITQDGGREKHSSPDR